MQKVPQKNFLASIEWLSATSLKLFSLPFGGSFQISLTVLYTIDQIKNI